MALDLKTGKVLWEKTAAEGPVKVKRHLKASHASSTPATDGKHLVAIFGPEGLFCYDLDGKLLWKKDLGTLDAGWFFNPAYQWGYASSPIIYKDFVIVQADLQQGSFIAAFRLADGSEAWRTPREEIPSWGTPTIVDGPSGPELVTNGSRYLRGYDPATGKELWRMQNRSEITVATPVAAQGLVLFTNGYRPVPSIAAVRVGARGDVSLKQGENSNEGVAWYKDKGGTYMPTPVVVGDQFYTLANQGVLTCYDAKSGEKLYQERIGGTGAAFTASPVAGDGRLYLASEDGDVWVIKAGPKYEQIAKNPMGEVMMATPAIAGGRILVRTRGNLVATSPPAPPPAAPATR
jgi:outer membrane protein assembly factor BamB